MNENKKQLGLKENWQQFSILVLVNAFVGGMVGLERSIFPKFAELEFGISSNAAILSFIVAFGISKAITNYFTGKLANRFGRRNLLLVGWLFALPIPFLLIYANAWHIVIFANILLGISQGLAWSSTVVMKIDLVGEKQRGLAMGLNEFAGYLAVGIFAFLSAYIADNYGVKPYPFYLGIVLSVLGLFVSFFFVRDTRSFVRIESVKSEKKTLKNIFWQTTLFDKNLGAITQAGLVNNLNDGMIWGLLPLFLLQSHYSEQNIGIIAAIYPTFWGFGQLITGKLSDLYPKKALLFWGMFLQGLAILCIPFAPSFYFLATLSALLGVGTAMVYPTFLSAIAAATSPEQRAESLGIFRFWRDLGYAIGAILSGITADIFGISAAIYFIAGITLFSAIFIQVRMTQK